MTISEYYIKPIHKNHAIFLKLHGPTLKLYGSDCLGLVKVSHDD